MQEPGNQHFTSNKRGPNKFDVRMGQLTPRLFNSGGTIEVADSQNLRGYPLLNQPGCVYQGLTFLLISCFGANILDRECFQLSILQTSEIIGNHQKSSEIIWNHQKSLETIRNHQKSYEIIRNHMKSSEIIGNHQKSSEIIWNHQKSSETIRNHQKSSEIIWNHQKSSEIIRIAGYLMIWCRFEANLNRPPNRCPGPLWKRLKTGCPVADWAPWSHGRSMAILFAVQNGRNRSLTI